MDEHQEKLFSAAQNVLKKSYSPYSQFKVGASILTDKGNVYSGTNIENVSYGLTMCAEASAIALMIAGGETCIKEVLVMANHDIMCAPCGGCRQRIAEFAKSDTKIHMCNAQNIMESTTLSKLLPHTFEKNNIKR